ncbi:MAG: hypothetical protein ACK421_07715 [Pseudanabaenaceae cyanobacterium]
MIKIDEMHPLLRPSTLSQKKEEERLKAWNAVFYTVRAEAWKEACRRIRRNGIDNGDLIYRDGELETVDGLTLLQYFDEFKQEFNESFDRAFINATIDEMVEYSKEHFGKNYTQLMAENEERMAHYRNRQSTKPLHQQPKTDPVAEEAKRKARQKKAQEGDMI